MSTNVKKSTNTKKAYTNVYPNCMGSSSRTTANGKISETSNNFDYKIEDFFGWRKRCLFMLILGLIILITVNLALTLWILNVMEFSSEGMGQLKIVTGGVQLSGQTIILDFLRASSIRSRHGQPITIESSNNFTIRTRNRHGIMENQLIFGNDKLNFHGNSFRVTDTHGATIFSADQKEVIFGTSSLKIDGEGGAISRESIHTPLVRADAGKALRLESPTERLEVRAAQDVNIQSKAGSLSANIFKDIKLKSIAGNIRFETSNIMMPNLKIVAPLYTSSAASSLFFQPPLILQSSSSSSSSSSSTHDHRVYQLCSCSSGTLFLASPHTVCSADDSNVCR